LQRDILLILPMSARRYLLMNLAIASASGIIGYPVLKVWEGIKKLSSKVKTVRDTIRSI
jgi:hypothetical protein